MFQIIVPAADLIAISILALALYYPRHRRSDLAMSYLTVNVGVLAVATALNSTSVQAGLGLGLFGVLAIIRLRSAEIDHHEIAYYFAALSIGVIGGLGVSMGWAAVALMAAVVGIVAIADLKVFTSRVHAQQVLLDAAITDAGELRQRLEQLLGGRVLVATTRKVDLVNDTTLVDVRYQLDDHAASLPSAALLTQAV